MNFLIWGSSGHAKVLAEIIALRQDHQLIGFVDNDPNASPAVIGIPLIIGRAAFDTWLQGIHSDQLSHLAGIAAIGGSRGLDRLDILNLFEAAGMQTPSLIHPAANISVSTRFGRNCQFLMGACISATATFGDACIVNTNASVDHECTLADGVHVGPGATLCGCVEVGRGAFIGAGSVVLPRIQIGSNSTIGAGAVVVRDVPNNITVAGNPAKPIYPSSRQRK